VGGDSENREKQRKRDSEKKGGCEKWKKGTSSMNITAKAQDVFKPKTGGRDQGRRKERGRLRYLDYKDPDQSENKTTCREENMRRMN